VSANIGAGVVAEEDKVMGIVSERDIVPAVAESRGASTTHVLDVASTSLIWCDANARVAEVATEMMDRYVRHLLVEKNGQLVGIVSARHLLGAHGAADVESD
jgi:CBS domain-containing protein